MTVIAASVTAVVTAVMAVAAVKVTERKRG